MATGCLVVELSLVTSIRFLKTVKCYVPRVSVLIGLLYHENCIVLHQKVAGENEVLRRSCLVLITENPHYIK